MNNYESLQHIESVFSEFLVLITRLICGRCPRPVDPITKALRSHDEHGNFDTVIEEEIIRSLKLRGVEFNSVHHSGIFNDYIFSQKPISESEIENYFDDFHHGFFHGLCTAFITYYLKVHDQKVDKIHRCEHDLKRKTHLVWNNDKRVTRGEVTCIQYCDKSLESIFSSCLLHDF